ncbi:hypothetical protein PF008_g18120 [Phytophthora fragariae]|uniref:Uncharacterized protein n=1 Tax=Phytophthora fragariae TaxID=53985 RepID=A0A6G0R6E5_9STRA|nr:hypothetical protein PF008_g18120 [Phytophthora fragariae]
MANVADVANLASSLQAGVTSVLGVKADFKVQEMLNEDLLKTQHAPPRPTCPLPRRACSRTPTACCSASPRALTCCRRRPRISSTPVGASEPEESSSESPAASSKPSGSKELPPRATPAARCAHCRIAYSAHFSSQASLVVERSHHLQ